jgi:hypothetical protein
MTQEYEEMLKKGIKVISWNVLHRIHEIKYRFEDSVELKIYPREEDRIKKQIEILKKNLTGEYVICSLQEVSGDLLSAVENHFNDTFNIFGYKHPRIPTLVRSDGTLEPKVANIPAPYTNPAEFLVTLVSKSIKLPIDQYFIQLKRTVATDKSPVGEYEGKAALVLKLNNVLTIINGHFPIRNDIDIYMKDVFDDYVIKKENRDFLIMGDFNSPFNIIYKEFKKRPKLKITGFAKIPKNEYSLTTHPVNIDHIISIGKIYFDETKIVGTDRSSDHNLVVTRVSNHSDAMKSTQANYLQFQKNHEILIKFYEEKNEAYVDFQKAKAANDAAWTAWNQASGPQKPLLRVLFEQKKQAKNEKEQILKSKDQALKNKEKELL